MFVEGSSRLAKKNQQVLIIIMGVPLFLIILSYTLIYLVDGKKLDLVSLLGSETVGTLIQPLKPVSELMLINEYGEAFDYLSEKPKWTLLVLNDELCGQRCEDNLLQSRQMHIALGKKQHAMRRYQLYRDGRIESYQLAELKKDHDGLITVYTTTERLNLLLADQKLPNWNQIAYLLLDPRGWIMMYYSEDKPERQIMRRDLLHLFKYAQ